MNIDYVTGLIDGDGSINFSFPRGQRRVSPNVTVVASLDDRSVLEDLVIFFGCGFYFGFFSSEKETEVEKKD